MRRAAATDTVRRVLLSLGPNGLPALLPRLVGKDRPKTLAADGKIARGSRTRNADATHLLSVTDEKDQVIAQMEVPDKTNEIPCLRALLAPFDIEGTLVTADALHTRTDTVRFLADEKKARFLFTVKANQPAV